MTTVVTRNTIWSFSPKVAQLYSHIYPKYTPGAESVNLALAVRLSAPRNPPFSGARYGLL